MLVGSVHVIFQMAPGGVNKRQYFVRNDVAQTHVAVDFETTPEIGEESKAKL